jgi:hypothetical protein
VKLKKEEEDISNLGGKMKMPISTEEATSFQGGLFILSDQAGSVDEAQPIWLG